MEDRFVAAPDLAEWVHEVMIDEAGPLYNPRYQEHNLQVANLGFLWANTDCVSKGRRIAGRCSIGDPRGGDAWKIGKKAQQIREWFGQIPDFVITLDATYVVRATRPTYLALIEHELHHCGQRRDKYGMPQFHQKTGRPKYTVLAHDVEEFAGVVRRYGAEAANAEAFVQAAQEGPTVAEAEIDAACGTCLRRAA